MICPGKSSLTLEDILENTTEAQIASYYLNVNKIPCVMNSPLRKDTHPSFSLYSPDGKKINYIDFSTNDRGNIYTLLKHLWKVNFDEVLVRINKDFKSFNNSLSIRKSSKKVIITSSSNISLKCKIRDWRDYDIEYWKSYGISLKWLKYANVYPITHKIIIKDNNEYVFGADKYAYAFVEFKENKVTMKIYQPYNKNGFKWTNSHDRSVLSLWTKVPEYGDKICICSSLKDALCLWSNTGIPAISVQGEGYSISNTAIKELKKRFKKVYILFDNDEAGIKDGKNLAESTGFINILLPKLNNQKDISDIYKSLTNKFEFKNFIINLFN